MSNGPSWLGGARKGLNRETQRFEVRRLAKETL